MGWSLSQTVYPISDDPGNNRRLYRTDVYLNWGPGYARYEGYNTSGGGSVDGQGFSWSGPADGGSYSGAGSQVINTSDFWIYGDANGWHGDVGASSWFNGGGGYAPGYISASASTGGFDWDRRPGTPSSLTATLNSNKTVTLTSNAVGSPAGTATYRFEYAYSTDGGGSWSGWSAESTTTSNTITLNLTYGRLYQFRVRVSNSDGYTGYYQPGSTLFVPAGGKIWNGSSFVNATTSKIHKGGGTWNTVTLAKRHVGSNVWTDLT